MNQTKIIARNLRKRRKELNLTQEATAKDLEIKAKRYASWEQGKSEPPSRLLPKITEVLQVDDLYLFLTKG